MEKRGAAVMSLSWIFMIIVGSFFIVFAYHIISTYQENETAKSELEFELALQNIFNKVGYSKGSETTSLERVDYVFEDSRVELYCEGGFTLLSVNSNIDPTNNYLKNYPFFMSVIEQDKIDETYIAVEEFDLPFYITPLMALVSKRNLYVFDKEIWENTFEDKFSRTSAFKGLNTRFIDFHENNEISDLFDEVEDLDLSSITFVSDDLNYRHISTPSPMSNVERINLVITTEDKTHNSGLSSYEFTSGKIIYKNTSYWNSNLSDEYTFNYTDYKKSLSLPSFAIFSRPESFSCGLNQVDSLITSTYNYYLEKTNILIEEINENSDSSRFCSENLNKNEVLAGYQKIYEAIKNMRDFEDRFKNINHLNDLLEELWKTKDYLDTYNCIDIY